MIEPEEVKQRNQDKNFLLEVVKTQPLMLEWASEELKNDKEIVLTAVRSRWRSLRILQPRTKRRQRRSPNRSKQCPMDRLLCIQKTQ